MSTQPKMLNIRIGYDTGRKLKAVCALRGRTVRDVIEEFASSYVTNANELPPATAAQSVRYAALTQAVANQEALKATGADAKRSRKPRT